MYLKKAEFKDLSQKKIGEIKIGTKPVVTVSRDTPAIDAFRLMDNKKYSGLAVVDQTGRFVGNTSASDLKVNIFFEFLVYWLKISVVYEDTLSGYSFTTNKSVFEYHSTGEHWCKNELLFELFDNNFVLDSSTNDQCEF